MLILSVPCLFSLVAVGSIAGSEQDSESAIVYVGSGGCDGTDKGCREDAALENVTQAIMVLRSGLMQPIPSLVVPTLDLAIWLSYSSGHRHCIFATLGQKNEVLPISIFHNPQSGKAVPSGGSTPVFAATTTDGKTLLVANYNRPDNSNTSDGAAVSSFGIADDCSLTLVDVKPHNGSSVNPSRQGGAHAHSFVPVRDGLAYACDLGMDVVFTYAVAPTGKLTEIHRTPAAPGSGPRHLVQHPSASIVYVINEMGQTVTAWEQCPGGGLKLLQTETLVLSGTGDGSKASEILIRPDGSALYASNRGKLNTVTVFGILPNGTLVRKQQVEVPAYPRGMTFALGGSLLLVAGQSSTEVASFYVTEDGTLEATGHVLRTGLPQHPVTLLELPSSGSKALEAFV